MKIEKKLWMPERGLFQDVPVKETSEKERKRGKKKREKHGSKGGRHIR